MRFDRALYCVDEWISPSATLGSGPDEEGGLKKPLVTYTKEDRRRIALEKRAAGGTRGSVDLDDDRGKNDSVGERHYRQPKVQAGLRPKASKCV